MGQVSALGTQFRREETTIKGGGGRQGIGGLKPLSHRRRQKKLLGPCRGPILFGKLSSSQLDREAHRVNYYPYTKA